MERSEKIELAELLAEKERRRLTRKLFSYYPDAGPLRRELYVKHNQFFEAGTTYPERLMLAANRIGKTEGVGGFETVLHLTGLYPSWWKGKRFNRPITAWAAGDTAKTVREIIQEKLLGPPHAFGTGLIPKDLIIKTTRKQGVADAVDTILVRHVSGGVSTITLKSYDQKRISFQGTKIDLIWLDEEPPLDIYTECLLRTMDTTGVGAFTGMMILTFTPLEGLSETVMQFLPNGEIKERIDGSKFIMMATWDDAPHLSEDAKKQLWKSIPEYQRDARSKGIPQLGSGAIYPFSESEIFIDDFPIPEHWPRGFSLDVGWNKTSAGFWAYDRENDVLYRIGEYQRGQAEPSIHAAAIRARGEWLPGVVDPAARGRSQVDGSQLLQMYKDLGLELEVASNAVEAGIYQVWERLSQGRLKIFKSCNYWKQEFRLYRRDEKGRIVKENDHAMDETRYFVMSGIERMKAGPTVQKKKRPIPGGGSWMS